MNKTLTMTERLILCNQFEILKKLYPENENNYETFIRILESGYTCLYSHISFFNMFEIEKDLNNDKYYSLIDILNMYRHINMSIENTKDENVKELLQLHPFYFIFQGFDANNDIRFGILYELNKLGKWKEFKKINSHGYQPNYDEMVIRYKKLNINIHNILSYEQLISLIPE